MKYSEWDDSNTLCCCEYYNIEEERSHILGCCCNCVALDESFESLIRGNRIPSEHKLQLMATIQDRVRIPWRGGAKQITADTIVPVILVPSLVFIAAYDLILSVLLAILTPVFLNHAYKWLQQNHPKSKFFLVWTLMSALTILLIFEVKVISLLEILPEENFILFLLTGISVLLMYRLRVNPSQNQMHIGGQIVDVESEDFCTHCKRRQMPRMFHCNVCQNCIGEKDFHFVWFDCCIGKTNRRTFILFLLFTISTLLYSTNLTLTTVCHPFTVFGTIMLPDDCSEVYDIYEIALCFTSAMYSLLISLYLFYIYLRHVLIISIGLTGQEWLQLPFATRLRCGLYSIRPYDKGLIRNWLKVICNKNDET